MPTQTPAETPAAPASWTPYTPDPAKSLQENLAAKEEYDKKVPAGHDPNKPLAPAAPTQQQQTPAPAPAQIAFTDLTVPEGFALDPAMGTEFIQLLNQHSGDPKTLANKLVELQVKAQAQLRENDSKAWDGVLADWKKEAEADPEIGGQNYSKITSTATQLVQRFGGEKLTQALELTGFGSHPAWLRFVKQLAPFVTEAGPVTPPTPTPKVQQASSTNFYPGMDQKK